jgi:endonuclease/exonuclease/phosphatase family metal-dependent hydrolase
MQQDIRFATFNVCNLAPPGLPFYGDRLPYTMEQYEAKISWIARQLDELDADVIGFQEIFSQDALRDVLARTEKYCDAHHLGIDPVPHAGGLTPSVALVSRLPVGNEVLFHDILPSGLSVDLPGVPHPADRFARPVLQARIRPVGGPAIDVFVVHLKSKRPDTQAEREDTVYESGMAALRSLIRRGAEALGVRYLLVAHLARYRAPLVVLGDFNDDAGSVPVQIVLGTERYGDEWSGDRLFDSQRIQSRHHALRRVGYTHLHDGNHETVDHILVSEAFHPDSRKAVGEVVDVIYRNDHLAWRRPEASDHGIVCARIRLREPA